MAEKFGIENVKNLVMWAVGTAQKIYSKTTDDGKFDFMDSLSLLGDAVKLVKIIQDADKLKDEWHDMSESERTEINKSVCDKFDILEDKIETVVEETIDMVLYNVKYITDLIEQTK